MMVQMGSNPFFLDLFKKNSAKKTEDFTPFKPSFNHRNEHNHNNILLENQDVRYFFLKSGLIPQIQLNFLEHKIWYIEETKF